MRNAFIASLCAAAASNSRIWLVTGDVGYSVLEPFATQFPGRFVNCGVAEQLMTSVAAGLALEGAIVFTYSIANFPTLRCLEQIRNDVCAHNLAVRIVAVGGGFAYGSAGYTHHAVEDFAFLGHLPNMTVVAPADPVEARLAVKALIDWPGPAYLRLGRSGDPTVHSSEPQFQLGRMIMLRQGSDATLISTGGMLQPCMLAADALAEQRIDISVLSCPTLVPFDDAALVSAARSTRRIITVEEHGPGGLGSRAAIVLAENNVSAKFRSIHLKPVPARHATSQRGLCAAHGLTTDDIIRAVRTIC